MDYRFWVILTVGFIIGRISKLKLYIGSDNGKYCKADYGILLKKRNEEA
jgi:hypothetical protein